MPIPIVCQCGAKMTAKEKLAGRRVKCPKCQGSIDIPALDQPVQAEVVETPLPEIPQSHGSMAAGTSLIDDPVAPMNHVPANPQFGGQMTPAQQPAMLQQPMQPGVPMQPGMPMQPGVPQHSQMQPAAPGQMGMPAQPTPMQAPAAAMPAPTWGQQPVPPKPTKDASSQQLIVGLAGGGIGLLVLIGVGLIMFSSSSSTNNNNVAQPNSTPAPSPAPTAPTPTNDSNASPPPEELWVAISNFSASRSQNGTFSLDYRVSRGKAESGARYVCVLENASNSTGLPPRSVTVDLNQVVGTIRGDAGTDFILQTSSYSAYIAEQTGSNQFVAVSEKVKVSSPSNPPPTTPAPSNPTVASNPPSKSSQLWVVLTNFKSTGGRIDRSFSVSFRVAQGKSEPGASYVCVIEEERRHPSSLVHYIALDVDLGGNTGTVSGAAGPTFGISSSSFVAYIAKKTGHNKFDKVSGDLKLGQSQSAASPPKTPAQLAGSSAAGKAIALARPRYGEQLGLKSVLVDYEVLAAPSGFRFYLILEPNSGRGVEFDLGFELRSAQAGKTGTFGGRVLGGLGAGPYKVYVESRGVSFRSEGTVISNVVTLN